MNVFVFGATGFLGRVLVSKLVRNGLVVSVLTRDRLRAEDIFPNEVIIHVGDMADGIYPDLSKYDVVINCAGEVKKENLMRRLHVDAINKALSCLNREGKTQWIQISSVGVYGPHSSGLVSEVNTFNPIGEYEVTKADGDILVKELCSAKGIPFTIIRPSNVFGNDMPNQSLSKLVQIIKRNMFIFIGNPDFYMMNYVHVDDVIEAITACMGNPDATNNDFIVSDVMDQRSFVQLVKSEVGSSGWTPVLPGFVVRLFFLCARIIPGSPLSKSRFDALTNRTVYSVDKIKNSLGFAPKVGCSDGVRQYCQYLMRNS